MVDSCQKVAPITMAMSHYMEPEWGLNGDLGLGRADIGTKGRKGTSGNHRTRHWPSRPPSQKTMGDNCLKAVFAG